MADPTKRNKKQTSPCLQKETGKLSHTILGIPLPQISTQNTVIYDNLYLSLERKTP
jgi:hypothetical protein